MEISKLLNENLISKILSYLPKDELKSILKLKPTLVQNLSSLNDSKVIDFVIDTVPNIVKFCFKFMNNNELVFDIDLLIKYLKINHLYINFDDQNIYIYNYEEKPDRLIYAKISEPCLVAIGNNWISERKYLKYIEYHCPQLITVYDYWMMNCESIETVKLYCSKLRNVGFGFMHNCPKLKKIYFNDEYIDSKYDLRKKFDLITYN